MTANDWYQFREFLVSEAKNKYALPMFGTASANQPIESDIVTVVKVPQLGEEPIDVKIPNNIKYDWARLNNDLSYISQIFTKTEGNDGDEYVAINAEAQSQITESFDHVYDTVGMLWTKIQKTMADSVRRY